MEERRNEMRAAPRVPLRVRLQVTDRRGVVIHGWARNISIVGVYVETRDRLAVGAVCDVSGLASVDGALVKLRAQGHIARHDNAGMGIQFTDLCPEAKAAIQTLVVRSGT